MAEDPELVSANPISTFYLSPPVTASAVATVSRALPSPLPAAGPDSIFLPGVLVSFVLKPSAVVETFADMALQMVGSSTALIRPSRAGFISASPAATLAACSSFESFLISTNFPDVPVSDVVSLARQLAVTNRQRDETRPNLPPFPASSIK